LRNGISFCNFVNESSLHTMVILFTFTSQWPCSKSQENLPTVTDVLHMKCLPVNPGPISRHNSRLKLKTCSLTLQKKRNNSISWPGIYYQRLSTAGIPHQTNGIKKTSKQLNVLSNLLSVTLSCQTDKKLMK
jgi:hypothetical protein